MNTSLLYYSGELPAGNAHSTAYDMFKFGEMLRLGGAFNGAKILSPAMVKYAMNNFSGDLPNSSVINDCYRLGIEMASPRSFAGIGGGSTMVMFDPERESLQLFIWDTALPRV